MPTIELPIPILSSIDEPPRAVAERRAPREQISEREYTELLAEQRGLSLWGPDAIVDAIDAAALGFSQADGPERVLATVLFTDLVGATELAAHLGDRAWCDVLAAHHATVRRQLERFGGREIDTAGDSFLATFDIPSRAIRAACAIASAVESLGLEIRAGLHAGEIELLGNRIAGIAVHITARMVKLAGPGEVLVSSTVADLVAGSGLRFGVRGRRRLKGLPGLWRVFAVDRDGALPSEQRGSSWAIVRNGAHCACGQSDEEG